MEGKPHPTVAVDLDGTLAEYDGWKGEEHIGAVRPGAREAMESLKERGCRIIIFTTRGRSDLVRQWLIENNITFDHINENPSQPPGTSGKVIADLYLDDRAIPAGGEWQDILRQTLDKLDGQGKSLEVVQERAAGAPKYGCLLAILPEPLRKEINDWSLENIPEFHLGAGQRELRGHATIKYGFEQSDEETIQSLRALLVRTGPITIRLGGLSLFTGGEDGDVLKMDVESPQLHELNAVISASFACHDKFPEYKPHVTIAYLLPEISGNYASLPNPFQDRTVVLDSVEWSGADGARETIPLSFLGGLQGTKGKGEPCQQGQTAEKVECIPASEEGSYPAQEEDAGIKNSRQNKLKSIGYNPINKGQTKNGVEFEVWGGSEDTAGTYLILLPENLKEIGRGTISKGGAGDYFSSVRIDDEFQRQGIGTVLYKTVEEQLGRKLRPSPKELSPKAEQFWSKRNVKPPEVPPSPLRHEEKALSWLNETSGGALVGSKPIPRCRGPRLFGKSLPKPSIPHVGTSPFRESEADKLAAVAEILSHVFKDDLIQQVTDDLDRGEKYLDWYQTKSKGQRCKQGETQEKTECIPEKKKGSGYKADSASHTGSYEESKLPAVDLAKKMVGGKVLSLLSSHGIQFLDSTREDIGQGRAAYLKYQGRILIGKNVQGKWDVLHEIGHALDASLYSNTPIRERKFDDQKYWSEENLKKVLAEDLKTATPKREGPSWENKAKSWEYAFSSPQEAFAHIFARLHGSQETTNGFSVQDAMPKTYAMVAAKLGMKAALPSKVVASESEERYQPKQTDHYYGDSGGMPKEMHQFLVDWMDSPTVIPTDSIIKELSKYVPVKSITLYRGGKGGRGNVPLKSWSHSKEVAEGFVEEGEKLTARKWHPDEILVDFTMLPDEYKEALEKDMVDAVQEVVTAYGDTLKRMKQVRGSNPLLQSPKVRSSPFRKSLNNWWTKGKGEPCKRGETAVRSGCVPAKGGSKKTPPKTKEPTPTADHAHAVIQKAIKSGHATPYQVWQVVDVLVRMRVKDLNELKKKLGVKASGTKSVLASKLARRAMEKPKIPKPEPAPAAARVTEKPPLKDRLAKIEQREKIDGVSFVDRVANQYLAKNPPQEYRELIARAQQGKAKPGDESLARYHRRQAREKLGEAGPAVQTWLRQALSHMADMNYGELSPAEFVGLLRAKQGKSLPPSPFHGQKSLPNYSVKEGFSGTKKDRAGRTQCYDNGSHVACNNQQHSGGKSTTDLSSEVDRAKAFIDQSNLDDEQKEKYAVAIQQVLHRMTPTALALVGSRVKRYEFYRSPQELTEAIAKRSPAFQKILDSGKTAGGAYRFSDGTFSGDGGQNAIPAHAIYAHEFGHAIDGEGKDRISDSKEWHEAWSKEIAGENVTLSRYGQTSTLEGFAEFSRAVHTAARPEVLAGKFPLCTKVWRERGLMA